MAEGDPDANLAVGSYDALIRVNIHVIDDILEPSTVRAIDGTCITIDGVGQYFVRYEFNLIHPCLVLVRCAFVCGSLMVLTMAIDGRLYMPLTVILSH